MNYILTSLTHYLLSRKHLIGVLNFIANKNFWLILVIRNILYKPARGLPQSWEQFEYNIDISIVFSFIDLLIEIIVFIFLIGKGIYVNGLTRFFECRVWTLYDASIYLVVMKEPIPKNTSTNIKRCIDIDHFVSRHISYRSFCSIQSLFNRVHQITDNLV